MFITLDTAKLAANLTLQAVVAKKTATIIVNHTEKELDSPAVKIPSLLVGKIVADNLRDKTDYIVEKTAVRVAAFRVARQNKKNQQ